jgi:mono/diheme cytochrome c family protein
MSTRTEGPLSARSIAALFASVLVAQAPSAFADPRPDAASISRGLGLVRQNCSMCHAIGPTGDSPNPAAPHFRDLHERYAIDDLGEALSEGIMVNHQPVMPQLHFSSDDVRDILAYLNSIQSRRRADAGRARPGG